MADSRFLKFMNRQGKQREDGGPPGKGLGNSLPQTQLMGTREDKTSVFGAGIHFDLQITQQLRYPLYFVE